MFENVIVIYAILCAVCFCMNHTEISKSEHYIEDPFFKFDFLKWLSDEDIIDIKFKSSLFMIPLVGDMLSIQYGLKYHKNE